MTEDKIKKDDSQNQNDTQEIKGEAKEEQKEQSVSEQNDDVKTEKQEAKESGDKEEKKEGANKRVFKKNFRKRRTFRREKPEFEQKILSIRRVTRVMAGGRRFSFSVAMVIGDKKGRVGVGLGKANDTVDAIGKAIRDAKKNMIKVSMTDTGSVPYDVSAKYKASKVTIRPVVGKGLAAGGAVRIVLELAGIKEAGGKILSRSKNHINNARATVKALAPFSQKVRVNLADNKKGGKKFGGRSRKTFGKRKFGGNGGKETSGRSEESKENVTK